MLSQELPKRLQKRYSSAMLGLGAQWGDMKSLILVGRCSEDVNRFLE